MINWFPNGLMIKNNNKIKLRYGENPNQEAYLIKNLQRSVLISK